MAVPPTLRVQLLLTSVLTAAVAAVPAAAQTTSSPAPTSVPSATDAAPGDDGGALPVIILTATKRETNLQKTPSRSRSSVPRTSSNGTCKACST